MKVLFIVQGEGRGHLTQAISLEKLLNENGHEVVEVLVGKSESRRIPGFFTREMRAPIKQFLSPNFLPAPSGQRPKLMRSILYNLFKLPEYFESMRFINRQIKSSGADLVINFYELLAGWTYFFLRPSAPMVCIGHQYLFLHKDFERPQVSRAALLGLNLFTRMTSLGASLRLALSFRPMKEDEGNRIRVVPPLLRPDVYTQEPTAGDYIHGYMVNAGFSEYIFDWHKKHPQTPLRFFWDKWDEEPVKRIDQTLSFYQLDDEMFLRQLSGCKAYATTAGFESVCEAMYLEKPVMMVPAHIEQACNAFDACRNGAGISDESFHLDRLLSYAETYRPNTAFKLWAQSARYILPNELERFASPCYSQNMFMVEEYV